MNNNRLLLLKTTLFKILLLLLIANDLRAQELLPFVENFTKSEYQGDNQNWNITQGQDNAIYVANNHYFFRYQGVKWEKYTLPNKTIIRSVASFGDKIYCGSYKEFGYWQRSQGKMQYYSLTNRKNLFTGQFANEEVWKIFKVGAKIYFQSFNVVFIYDGNNIQTVTFPHQISYCYPIDGEIFVATVRDGIYKLKGNKFEKIPQWNAIEGSVVHHMERHDGKMYIFTKTQGIYVDESGVLKNWRNPLNDNLKQEIIVTAKFLKGNKLAIGTGLQGLYIIDLLTGKHQNIKRENALKNNAVLTMLVDREDNLWLGLDNGIAHVEINSSIEVFMDTSGILGSVYALSPIGEGYLFVTNHGVFRYQDHDLHAIPNSQGQVWDIYKLDDGRYVIGHNDGTFIYDGSSFKKLNDISGGWKFFKSQYDNAYFQANYAGIANYRDEDLLNSHFFGGFSKPIRNIAQNKPGEIWAADNYRSLYQITYDENFKTIKIVNISQQNGILSDFGVKLFSYKSEILFLINKTWYTYNAISGKLQIDSIFNRSFGNISDIIPVDDQNFIILNSGLLYLITQTDDDFRWELIPEKYYEGKLILEDTKVYKTKNKILLNLDDGFLAYEMPTDHQRKPVKIGVEGYVRGKLIDHNSPINFNQSIEIDVITGLYGYNHFDLFYKLNKSQEYIRIRNGNMVLSNLRSGTQDIEFYEFTGNSYQKVATYQFEVRNPWYFSFYMILVYFVVIAAIFFLYYRWNKVRYSQKMQLREEELKHQRQILEIELKAENEHNVQEYQKHILEIEIQSKASQVTGKSLSIAKQTEMIGEIQQILETETDLSKLKNEIRKAIRINEVNKHEWETFEANLTQMNNDFIVRLTQKYPNLTSKDIKLCVFLKMNLSSKEIAPMMNISFRGVELHRYRLRKKLELQINENLSKFMLSI